jgi:hypothetical protein
VPYNKREASLAHTLTTANVRASWSDGITYLLFAPVERLERLAALTPRPRVDLVLYHGVLIYRKITNSSLIRRQNVLTAIGCAAPWFSGAFSADGRHPEPVARNVRAGSRGQERARERGGGQISVAGRRGNIGRIRAPPWLGSSTPKPMEQLNPRLNCASARNRASSTSGACACTDGDEPDGVRHAGLSAHDYGMSDPILLLDVRNRYKKQRVAKSPVPDTARQSPHRSQMRLVIRVDEGPGCRLHSLQQLTGGTGRWGARL